jgi:hypothetical protein
MDATGSLTVAPATGAVKVTGALESLHGGARYTELGVRFLFRVIDEELTEEKIQRLPEQARLFANYFLDSYRCLFGDSWVYPLSEGEFYRPRHGKSVQYRAQIRRGDKGEERIGATFGPSGSRLRGMPNYAADEQGRFRELLLSGTRPALPDLLMLNARRYLDLGEFRVAVMESAAALDVEVEVKAHKQLVKGGMSSGEAQAKLEKVPTKNIVEQILEPAFSQSVVKEPEWAQYVDWFRPLRNKVVHDAFEPSRSESEDCVRLVGDLLVFFRNRPASTP